MTRQQTRIMQQQFFNSRILFSIIAILKHVLYNQIINNDHLLILHDNVAVTFVKEAIS